MQWLDAVSTGHPENNWDSFIKQIQNAINCTHNSTTGVSPLETLASYKLQNVTEAFLVNEVQSDISCLD